VLFAGVIGERDVLFLHGDPRHWHEAGIAFTGRSNGPRVWSSDSLHPDASATDLIQFNHESSHFAGQTVVTLLPGIQGLVVLWDSETQLVLYADTETAGKFFAPVLTGSFDLDPFASFWGLGSNMTLLVGGPYLVRSATLLQGGQHLALRGDLEGDAYLTVFPPESVREFSWNGAIIENIAGAATEGSSMRRVFLSRRPATAAALQSFTPPGLETWVFHDGLPEIGANYDDARWVKAGKTTTNIPWKPLFGGPEVLYGCDYGLYV